MQRNTRNGRPYDPNTEQEKMRRVYSYVPVYPEHISLYKAPAQAAIVARQCRLNLHDCMDVILLKYKLIESVINN